MALRYAVPWCALLCALAGCVSRPANFVEPGHEGAPAVRRFLLCPPNLVLTLHPQLERGSRPLQHALAEYLRSHGREVEGIGLLQARRLWSQAVEEAKGAESPGLAVGIFVRRLAEGRDFQALVMPSLLLHQTRVVDSSGSWDGVRRRMAMVNAPSLGIGTDQDTLAEGIAFGGISGEVYVTSVHVMVFSRDGRRVFEGRGGLEFVHEIDMFDARRTYEYQLRLREDLLRDAAVMREGVEIALTPYLPPPRDR